MIAGCLSIILGILLIAGAFAIHPILGWIVIVLCLIGIFDN